MNKSIKIRIPEEHEGKFFIISSFVSLLCNTYVEYLLTSYSEEELKNLVKELHKRERKERKNFILELLGNSKRTEKPKETPVDLNRYSEKPKETPVNLSRYSEKPKETSVDLSKYEDLL